VIAGSMAFAVVRGLALWRQFKASAGDLSAALERLTDRTEAVAERAERLGSATDGLDASLSRLGRSRARLGVLQHAWSEATSGIGTARSYVPREKKA
jgi:hypothetical protein